METQTEKKHEWIRTDNEDSDKIVCVKCGIDYDEWVEKMLAKGYKFEDLKGFEKEW